MISAYNQHTTVSNSEFAWMGGSAIAAWGWTDEISDGGIHGVDGTTGTFPRYTKVRAGGDFFFWLRLLISLSVLADSI